MVNRYIVALLYVGACSIPDVRFTELTADAAGDTGNQAAMHAVVARWSFVHIGNPTLGSCPHASDVARVFAQPWDPTTQQTKAAAVPADFACADGQGTVELSTDAFLMWVDLRSATGQVLARSNKDVVDTARTGSSLEAKFYDDAGYVALSWKVVNKATLAGAPCGAAGITSSDWIEVAETLVDPPNYTYRDKFTCDDHFGTTGPLAPAHYSIIVKAVKNNAPIGDPVGVADVEIVLSGLAELTTAELKIPIP